jgi:hypothetical protein
LGREPSSPRDSPTLGEGSFSGQLSETPLFVVLRRIQRDRLSGTLSVFRGEQVRQLFFEQGELRSARSSREDHRIGATLVRWGYISEQDLEDALEVQKQTHQRIDQILVERGHATRAVVDSEARRQMEQIIFSTLAWPDGAFHFEPNTGTAELDVSVSFSEDVIIEGIRRIPESEQFVELLGDLKSVPHLTKDPMTSIAFRLLKDAVDVLAHIDGKTSFEGLLRYASTSSSAAAKVLYSLMFAGLIEAGPPEEEADVLGAELPRPTAEQAYRDETRPLGRRDTAETGPDVRPAVRPTAAGSGASQANRQVVLDTYRQLDWLSHYDLLGVARKATPQEIDQAYKGRARLFDPTLKAHPELVDLWRQLTVLAKWLKVAYGVLSDPQKRANYDKKIEETTPPAESP